MMTRKEERERRRRDKVFWTKTQVCPHAWLAVSANTLFLFLFILILMAKRLLYPFCTLPFLLVISTEPPPLAGRLLLSLSPFLFSVTYFFWPLRGGCFRVLRSWIWRVCERDSGFWASFLDCKWILRWGACWACMDWMD